MSLGTDVLAQLPAFRDAADSLMLSTGFVRRKNGGVAEDPVTREEIPTYDVIYVGASKIRFGGTQPSTGEIPGAIATEQGATLSLPIASADSANVTTGDEWVCTANPQDPALIGRVFRIEGVHAQTIATARRFPVSEAS